MTGLRRIRPTRRGVGVALVVGAAAAVAGTTGSRSLDAVVVPGGIALVVGLVQLARADPPSVTRSAPKSGYPGERRRVAVTVESAVPCTVVESVDDGLSLPWTRDGSVTATVGHGGRFEYAVELGSRGKHRLGPARCRLADSLGLFRADVEVPGSATVLVYPEVYDIDPGAFSGLKRGLRGGDRSTFDRLREYTPADAVRDIHWRASAKRPDEEFVVAEYGVRSTSDGVTVVGESAPGGADAMASAVASLVTHFNAVGTTVTVVVSDRERTASPRSSTVALRALALTEGGECSAGDRSRADIRVSGDRDGATLTAPDRGDAVAFESMARARESEAMAA